MGWAGAMSMRLAEIAQALAEIGLRPRGALPADDSTPPVGEGIPTRWVVLAGNAGPAMWDRFAAERPDGPHPLDAWSEAVLAPLAARLGARAVFPSRRPYLPFQRWAMAAEPCHASPLGILIHAEYGLWHGYRGALLFGIDLEGGATQPAPSPCDGCADRPCLSTCPVAAFTGRGYDVPACAGHLRDPAGEDCMDQGCRARRACPVGREYHYTPAQARFHMTAFRANHRADITPAS